MSRKYVFRAINHENLSNGAICSGAQGSKKVTGVGLKIDMDIDNFTHMQPRAPKGRNTKVCMWGEVPDLITPIKFNADRFRGFRSLRV